ATRLSAWQPSFEDGYQPGWEYQNALQSSQARPIVASIMSKLLAPLQKQAKLGQDAAYSKLAAELAAARLDIEALDAEFFRLSGNLPEDKATQRKALYVKIDTIARKMQEIEWTLDPDSHWHQRVGWKAEDYFEDEKVISLCHAIEESDVAKMEQLI